MRERSSSDHLSVAVEFKQADTANHPSTNKEVQLLTLEHNGNLESWELVIEQTNALNSGYIILELQVPGGPYWESERININDSAASLRTKLRPYYKKNFKTDIKVTSDTTS